MIRITAVIALMVVLSACHAGFGVGDNSGQRSTNVASDSVGSFGAQLPMRVGTATGG